MSNQNKGKGRVIWITGLSGAGKSTLAVAISHQLRKLKNKVILLDGDQLRSILSTVANGTDSYSRIERLSRAMTYSRICRLLADQGFTVVIATISMFNEIYTWNRDNLPGYFEIFLNVPIEELKRRDPKGIYRRFDHGQISNVAGLDLFVDEPVKPDLTFDFNPSLTVEYMVKKAVTIILKLGM